jgi:pSer/pThr/pTyr-binding forkhead associated (FHA) protein
MPLVAEDRGRYIGVVGVLRFLADGTEHVLTASCIVGRSTSCTLRVQGRFVSAEHAKILWTDARWIIRDLGSRNGTFVDGRRLDPGEPAPLILGSRIGFGEIEGTHVLSDDQRPGAIAIDTQTGEARAAVSDLLVLPSDDAPDLSIYVDPKVNGWVVEDADGSARLLADNDVLSAGGRTFRLELPVSSEETPFADAAMSIENVTLKLSLSRNQQIVEVALVHRGLQTKLERREHGHLLLVLARLRLGDAHLPFEERGWRTLQELSSMMKREVNAINVATHRVRQQCARAGLAGAARIIESRFGKRRLGTERVEIVEP